MPLKIVRNDITKVKADAIVNSANKNPICGGGAEYSIYEAAGREALLAAHVKQMIERQKQKYGWEFIFLGANIDAAREAARFVIHADYAANYNADREGTAVVYETVTDAICHVRACSAPLSADWKRKVDEDYKKRVK